LFEVLAHLAHALSIRSGSAVVTVGVAVPSAAPVRPADRRRVRARADGDFTVLPVALWIARRDHPVA